jgi:glycosyltransferase involved in cell wall biosynthesis
MRIALVVPSLSDPAHRRVLSSLRKRLIRARDQVLLFPPRDGLSPEDSRRKLENLLTERDVQICHVQFFSRGLGYLGRVGFPRGMKMVLTHQGAALDLMEHRSVFRRLADRADAVTSVSRHGLEEMLTIFPELKPKSHWISNGADAPAGLRKSHLPARQFVLSASRLAAYKGIDVLLLAFSGVAARHDLLDLVLCGPDQTDGQLQRFARKLGLEGRVRFLGDTKASALQLLMEQSLFFVLPSRKENMPMALLEALAAGKAVIAAAAGGVAEVLRDRENGLLVAPKSAAALEQAMDLLARDARLRRRLGRQASSSARLFGWARVAERYRELYAALVGANPRGDRAKKLKLTA